jgi:23S rRNA pseudouridine1911/1915/1917 synthase
MDNINVVFENEDFVVIEKPNGVVVNRSETQANETLQDFIDKNILRIEDLEEGTEFKSRSGLVHRLDKDTSGILLVAKNLDSFTKLQEKFKSREVEKKYVCVVLGEVLDDRFEIDAPISRNPNNRFKYAVVRDGKEAQTYFEKIKTIDVNGYKLTSLFAFPRTGRTHQIRVHLTANNCPVVIDPIYMSQKEQELSEILDIHRLMLHAKSLKFDYNGKEYFFESKLPKEFEKYIN